MLRIMMQTEQCSRSFLITSFAVLFTLQCCHLPFDSSNYCLGDEKPRFVISSAFVQQKTMK